MAGSNLVNPPAFARAKPRLRAGRSALTDDAKCFAFVRQHRWSEGVRCPFCTSPAVIRDGCDETQPCRQRYRCKGCTRRFDDLRGTVLAGRHQPLRMWVLCLNFMGLNLSNRQIAQELDLSVSDVQVMTDQLRHGLVAKIPAVELEGEIDESLLRSWLRPHRGISQEKLPNYLGFAQFVNNARRSGKALLDALITALVT